jgi:hypothetical protein
VQDFYFDGDAPFFVFRSKRGDTGGGGAGEERFYFTDGALLRWVDDRGRRRAVRGAEAQRVAADVLDRASVVARLARGEPAPELPETDAAGAR